MTTTLATLLADPYSIEDTSGCDPRLHAYRRIALAAHALGYDLTRTTQSAMVVLGWPRGKRMIDDLSIRQLEKVATAFEQVLDAGLCG